MSMQKRIRVVVLLLLFNTLFFTSYANRVWYYDRGSFGFDVIRLTATTLEVSYIEPFNDNISIVFNPGYTVDYSKSVDVVGFFLSPHCKCANDGYFLTQQSGAFINVGTEFNLKKEFLSNYFFIGVFFNGGYIHEKAKYIETSLSKEEKLKHTIFTYGAGMYVGYDFFIHKKWRGDIAFQVAAPRNIDDLYGYKNYVPGMGFSEVAKDNGIIMNVKGRLKYQL